MHDQLTPYGYCQCGCGQKTRIATQNDPRTGEVRGKPVRFKKGHHGRRPLAERFWEKVDKTDTCWLWTAYRCPLGYGRINVTSGAAPQLAHRIAYELCVGPIPDGLELDHLCRVPSCVNPAHLEPVTRRENVLRGIAPAAQYARRTHCAKGHPFDDENTGWHGGGRRCKTCHRDDERERQRAKREGRTLRLRSA